MIGNLGRRATEAVVLLFAMLGFAFVPLGERTALEHLGRILSTGAAAEAGRGLIDAVSRLRSRLAPAPAQAAVAPRLPPRLAIVATSPDASIAVKAVADAGAAPDASLQ